MKNKRKIITLILLLAVIALVGALLYLKTLERGALEESPDSASLDPEKDPARDEATELQDVKVEPEPEEEDFRVKVGAGEFPVLFEDGDYENLNKAGLIWTVNNLFEHISEFEIIEDSYSYKFQVEGREVEANFYLDELGGTKYGPDIRATYYYIVKEDGVDHLVLSREFIEAYIEASKYEEVTNELNTFIDRLNGMKSAEFDTLTEAQIDSLVYYDPRFRDESDLEEEREFAREFVLAMHFQSTNVFWIAESAELGRYLYGDNGESMIVGNAIYYKKEDYLRKRIDRKAPPPSNFDPRLHTDPDAEPFIWAPAGTWGFIYDDQQWKIGVIMPGT